MASKVTCTQGTSQPVDVTINATTESILVYGADGGELDRLQPLRTTKNGTLVVEGCVSVDNVIQAQCETELVGKTAGEMLATQKDIRRELNELHDTVLAMATMQEKTFKIITDLLEHLLKQMLTKS